MTPEVFKKYLNLLDEISKVNSSLYNLGVDLMNYEDKFYSVIDLLVTELFGEFGSDHLTEFELNPKKEYSKENPMCWDGETNEPLYWDADSLYDYLVSQKYICSIKS